MLSIDKKDRERIISDLLAMFCNYDFIDENYVVRVLDSISVGDFTFGEYKFKFSEAEKESIYSIKGKCVQILNLDLCVRAKSDQNILLQLMIDNSKTVSFVMRKLKLDEKDPIYDEYLSTAILTFDGSTSLSSWITNTFLKLTKMHYKPEASETALIFKEKERSTSSSTASGFSASVQERKYEPSVPVNKTIIIEETIEETKESDSVELTYVNERAITDSKTDDNTESNIPKSSKKKNKKVKKHQVYDDLMEKETNIQLEDVDIGRDAQNDLIKEGTEDLTQFHEEEVFTALTIPDSIVSQVVNTEIIDKRINEETENLPKGSLETEIVKEEQVSVLQPEVIKADDAISLPVITHNDSKTSTSRGQQSVSKGNDVKTVVSKYTDSGAINHINLGADVLAVLNGESLPKQKKNDGGFSDLLLSCATKCEYFKGNDKPDTYYLLFRYLHMDKVLKVSNNTKFVSYMLVRFGFVTKEFFGLEQISRILDISLLELIEFEKFTILTMQEILNNNINRYLELSLS